MRPETFFEARCVQPAGLAINNLREFRHTASALADSFYFCAFLSQPKAPCIQVPARDNSASAETRLQYS